MSVNLNLLYFLFSLIVCLILIQIYFLIKINLLIKKVTELFIKFDFLINIFKKEQKLPRQNPTRSCENCKNRIVYFHSEQESYFYLKCRLNNQPVSQEDCCHLYILDPQIYKT